MSTLVFAVIVLSLSCVGAVVLVGARLVRHVLDDTPEDYERRQVIRGVTVCLECGAAFQPSMGDWPSICPACSEVIAS